MQHRPLDIASAQPSLPFLPEDFVQGALSRASLSTSREEDVSRVKVEAWDVTSKIYYNDYGAVTWPQLSSNGTKIMFSSRAPPWSSCGSLATLEAGEDMGFKQTGFADEGVLSLRLFNSFMNSDIYQAIIQRSSDAQETQLISNLVTAPTFNVLRSL
jgi:hypothetical protein